MKTHYFTFFTTACLAVSPSHAALIASYDFTGGSPSATTSDANVTANDFTVGAGFTLGVNAGFSGSSHSAFARTSGTSGSGVNHPNFTNAKSADDYISVIITPDSGYYMHLTSFSFDYGYSSAGTFTDGNNTLRAYVTTSNDNHANFFNGNTDGYTTITDPVATASSLTFPNSKSLDLSDAAFQYIGSGGIEFRLYFSDSYNVNDLIHRIDNVTLNGTVAVVPEPSSTALLGLGGLAVLLRRKR